ncbi:hypothetical protein CBP36_19675 (plasmid) [Acidovorax carolinensis]|uniref:Uncharacterized protein n=1 Tax=Acidovorax carolinensis TaxID=553814 RepID=A0A240UI68_9BURK|nr:hypothetical protein CBP35_19630 [Acidovorax carolinensis]ART61187.1 hypothetical protein CBP36_19675 [Acidovorax carolinensis]
MNQRLDAGERAGPGQPVNAQYVHAIRMLWQSTRQTDRQAMQLNASAARFLLDHQHRASLSKDCF